MNIELKDWFAGQAMAALITRLSPDMYQTCVATGDWSCEAADAYRIAEAMIDERTSQGMEEAA